LWEVEAKGADKTLINFHPINHKPVECLTTSILPVAANLSALSIPHTILHPTLALAGKRQDNHFNEHAITCAAIKINDSKTLSKIVCTIAKRDH
jgi:hypothetical protein